MLSTSACDSGDVKIALSPRAYALGEGVRGGGAEGGVACETVAMVDEHHYRVAARWTGNRGTGTSGYRDYDRAVSLVVTGKPEIAASSDRPFRGDGTKWNPEDLLLAALSECHLLSYLHACVEAGIVVVSYDDEATGTMRLKGKGGAFTEVVLHPRVVVADETMVSAAVAAHAQAHEWCFIANSVNFPVRHEPTVTAQNPPA